MKILILLTIVISLIYIVKIHLQDSHNIVFKYYKCNKYKNTKVLEEVFDQNRIVRSYNINDWDIYLPCGYNSIESQLKNIKVNNINQKIFGISGCDTIVSKNKLWSIIENMYSRTNALKLMPESFLYSNSIDLLLFKHQYTKNTNYLIKKNLQRKKGIIISNNYNEIIDLKNNGFKVIQKYIENLYLIKERKVNLRMYLLIVCNNYNISFYLHNKGKCIYTNKNFKTNSLDPEIHLTSLNISEDIYKDRPQTLEDLKCYLGHYLYNKLITNINKNIILVIKACKSHLCNLESIKKITSFQLFGLDYMFTNEMYPYLLEMNKGPSMGSINDIDYKVKTNIMTDVFKIIEVVKNENNEFIKLSID
jgi:hypothetical protein